MTWIALCATIALAFIVGSLWGWALCKDAPKVAAKPAPSSLAPVIPIAYARHRKVWMRERYDVNPALRRRP